MILYMAYGLCIFYGCSVMTMCECVGTRGEHVPVDNHHIDLTILSERKKDVVHFCFCKNIHRVHSLAMSGSLESFLIDLTSISSLADLKSADEGRVYTKMSSCHVWQTRSIQLSELSTRRFQRMEDSRISWRFLLFAFLDRREVWKAILSRQRDMTNDENCSIIV